MKQLEKVAYCTTSSRFAPLHEWLQPRNSTVHQQQQTARAPKRQRPTADPERRTVRCHEQDAVSLLFWPRSPIHLTCSYLSLRCIISPAAQQKSTRLCDCAHLRAGKTAVTAPAVNALARGVAIGVGCLAMQSPTTVMHVLHSIYPVHLTQTRAYTFDVQHSTNQCASTCHSKRASCPGIT
ncbi:hypothetical protein M3J09_009868 [Ascochyta lentis]